MIPDLNLHRAELFCLTERDVESYQHPSVSPRTWWPEFFLEELMACVCKLISSAGATELRNQVPGNVGLNLSLMSLFGLSVSFSF